jgi:hypothetical protein
MPQDAHALAALRASIDAIAATLDTVLAGVRAIEAIAVEAFIDTGDGDYVAVVGKAPGLARDDGTEPEVDDVLSVQRDGSLQLRPAGSWGSFERCTKAQAGLLAYQPDGAGHRVFIVPYVDTLPNA